MVEEKVRLLYFIPISTKPIIGEKAIHIGRRILHIHTDETAKLLPTDTEERQGKQGKEFSGDWKVRASGRLSLVQVVYQRTAK